MKSLLIFLRCVVAPGPGEDYCETDPIVINLKLPATPTVKI